MITLTFTVDSISVVIQVYDQIQVQRSVTEDGTFVTVSGVGPVTLSAGVTSYTLTDIEGTSTDWYRSRYYSTITGYYSEWSEPVLGDTDELFYNPLYPDEVEYGTSQQLVIDRIRRLIGDPKRVRRIHGEDALAYVHTDGKTIELPDYGWPVTVIMGGVSHTSLTNPSVDGYKYLRFNDYIGDICNVEVTYSGCENPIEKTVEEGLDIFYYNFRNSDRQIYETYDATPAPPPLTSTSATAEVYMLAAAIDILSQELWEDLTEDGAEIRDEGTTYNPEVGLQERRKLLDGLKKKLDDLVDSLRFIEISGVLID